MMSKPVYTDWYGRYRNSFWAFGVASMSAVARAVSRWVLYSPLASQATCEHLEAENGRKNVMSAPYRPIPGAGRRG